MRNGGRVFGGGGDFGDEKTQTQNSSAARAKAEVEERRYGAWLCRVTSALLIHCKSPLLQLSRATAATHPPLAELLLPAALADLSVHHCEGGRIHVAVSAGVAKCLASDGGGCARVAELCSRR